MAAARALEIPTSLGRAAWLTAQRLHQRAPFGDGPAACLAAIRQLGYVQIDTINVIERCHHHILFSRIPGYRRADLALLQSVDKSVFEYWTHALSYVPTDDFRFFVRAMRSGWQERRWFAAVQPAEIARLLRRIARGGALTLRDIDDGDRVEKDHAWASHKPEKRALQLAFHQGRLTISQRQGMLKTYELTLRHFGWPRLPPAAREAETIAYLLDRALRAQAIVSLDSICHLDAPRKAAVRRLIEAKVRRRRLVPVAVQGAGRQEHWAAPETLEPCSTHELLVHVLSPFDPLIIQRRRLALFFDHHHRFEAYVPKAKRVFGYFALPVLVGDRIAAVIDCKTDRAAGRLLIQQWSWVGAGPQEGDRQLIEQELERFERFQLGG
jgi:hypothetical protein